MVTNLTQEAKAKWAEAIATRDPEVKLRLLKEFYSLMPKHKATERLEMSIKRQISALEEEVEERRSRGKRRGSINQEWTVKKEGVQLALAGSIEYSRILFESLTGVKTNVYDMLMKPKVGVFTTLNTRLQIVLTPLDDTIGESRTDRFIGILRNADAILVCVDSLEYLHYIIELLESRNINILSEVKAKIEYTPQGGIRIVGRSERVKESEVFQFIKGYGIKNAVVSVYNDTTLDDVEDAIFGRVSKKAVFVKVGNIKDSNTLYYNGNAINVVALNDRERFMLDILKAIGVIRIFTKRVGGEAASEPLLVNEGLKVVELARMIHKDIAKNLKFARVWRDGAVIKVGRDFILKDMDVVELH